MPSPLEFVIGALAVWRLSAMIAYERGPFRLFEHVREAAGIDHFDDGTPDTENLRGEFAHLLSCVWCISLYFALIWLAFWITAPDITTAISVIFAVSAGAVMVERVARG